MKEISVVNIDLEVGNFLVASCGCGSSLVASCQGIQLSSDLLS